jgi:hypothetical protein
MKDHATIGEGLHFFARNTEVMTIGDASGNARVGIGTASPANKLDVHSATENDVMAAFSTTSNSSSAGSAGLSAHFNIGSAHASNGFARITGHHNLFTNSVSELSFSTNAGSGITERMRIQGDGLGIDTGNINRTSNTVALTIGNGTADNYRSALELVGSEVTADDAVGTIAFWNVGGSGGQIATIAGYRTGANNSGALLFQTKNAGTNATRFTVTSSGGVYETGGVLKSNLLSNSGFDAWSQSTLEVVSANVTNGGFDSDANWTKQSGWTITGGYALATNCDTWLYQSKGVTVGKLYRVTITCSNFTDGSVAPFTYGGVSGTIYGTPLSGTGTQSLVFEAVDSTIYIGAACRSANSNLRVDPIAFDEVTPGCAANKAPDGWTNGTTTGLLLMRREHKGSNTKAGSFYALRMNWTVTNSNYAVSQNLDNTLAELERYKGRTLTFGCWIKVAAGVNGYIRIEDSAGGTSSAVHATSTYTWVEVTHTVNASATSLNVQLLHTGNDNPTTIYFSQPMLVFGSAIGEGNYTRPAGEIIWFEKRAASNALNAIGFSDVAFTTLNTEADSNGKVPKGARSLFVLAESNDSASASNNTFFRLQGNSVMDRLLYASCAGLANDRGAHTSTWQPCDSNGDFQYQLEASGSGTLDVYLNYVGVQLR